MVQEGGGGNSLKTTKTADIIAKSVRSILPKGFIWVENVKPKSVFKKVHYGEHLTL
jgi:hypothetical protein